MLEVVGKSAIIKNYIEMFKDCKFGFTVNKHRIFDTYLCCKRAT